MGSTFFFQNFVGGLEEKYPELFDGVSSETSQHSYNFGKKWKSYSTIVELANGDIRLMDDITELPLEKCLLFLAYKADKALLESLVHKEIMKSRG